jgi:beta-mannosidase
VQAAPRGQGPQSFVATVSARRPALWVCLELAGADARFSDNYFHLRPGKPAEIVVTPAKPMTAEQVRKALRAQSLVDWCR